jgi:OFA family oxalate/formate antiporter-like MFS transporter
LCGFIFALVMIPGGRIQDRYGPRIGATIGGLFLAGGCILSGLLKSYLGLLLGFGVMGGIGMGLGYAAATPVAVKWFGPHQRGLVVGLVVGGYGGAAIYISPLAKYLIAQYGLSGSFLGLGALFAVVILGASRLLTLPPEGYIPPSPPASAPSSVLTRVDWTASDMLKTWQFYGLVFLFVGSAQSGLLVIANATPMLNVTAKAIAFLAANAWILSSFGGFVNAAGRIGSGLYSDRIGRANAYLVNGIVAAGCLFLMPSIMASGNVLLLFLAVGVAYWQYGGGLALMPAFTADYFGPKNLGFNYGLIFIGWGIAFFVPQLGGYLTDATGSLSTTFYLSGTLLVSAVILSRFLRRPLSRGERGAVKS